ncbi:cache domain-containing protein [Paenibacillus sp. P26]|nr:cache domain-containing protein [Paenibacillus sp. P26]
MIYNQTLQEFEKEVTAANLNILQQSKDQLDRRFSEMNSIATQLVSDSRIMQFQNIKDPFEGANTYRILETRKSIYNYSLSNNFIFNYFVVFKNSDLVLAESSTYKLSDFHKQFRYAGMDAEQWKSLFTDAYYQRKILPAQDVTVGGIPYSLLTYIQSLGFPGMPQGAVAITVDNREIQKLLRGLDLTGGGWVYILNENGDIVSSIPSVPQRPAPPETEKARIAPAYRVDRSALPGKQGSDLQDIGGGR